MKTASFSNLLKAEKFHEILSSTRLKRERERNTNFGIEIIEKEQEQNF